MERVPSAAAPPACPETLGSVQWSRQVAGVQPARFSERRSAGVSTVGMSPRGPFHVRWPQSAPAGSHPVAQGARGAALCRPIGAAMSVYRARERVPPARFARHTHRGGAPDAIPNRPARTDDARFGSAYGRTGQGPVGQYRVVRRQTSPRPPAWPESQSAQNQDTGVCTTGGHTPNG